MPRTRLLNSLILVVGVLSAPLLAPAAFGADPVGPPIGTKNGYTTSIRTAQATADSDDYVGRLLEGEFLSVTVVAAKKSDVRPTLQLIRPDGSVITPIVKSKRGGKLISLKKFPIDATGAWAVRVAGGATEGAYRVSFKIKSAKPLVVTKELTGGALTLNQEFDGLETALLDLKIVFNKRKGAVTLDAIQDPSGSDVPGTGGPLAGEAKVKRNKISLAGRALFRGDGKFTFDVSTVGPSASFRATLRVVPQNRLKSKKSIELSADEPFVSIGGGALRAAALQRLTLTGANFASDARVFVGDVEATVFGVGLGGSSLEFEVPDGPIGSTADLRVVNGDGQGVAREDYLFFAPPPEITAIRDPSGATVTGGSTTGGQTLRIIGNHLVSQDIVRFGATDATLLRVISASELEISTPASGKALVNVTARDEFGRGSATALDFEYKVPPTFGGTPYAPVLAPTNTQKLVTINGTGFENSDVVFFNSQLIASTLLSSTQRSFTVPSSPSGDYSVAIRDRVGTIVQGPRFSVKEPPVLTSASVISGPEANTGEIPLLGGSRIRVTGNHFSVNDTVSFGGTTVTLASRSLTVIEFDSPPHAPGTADLVVTDVGNNFAQMTAAFRYEGFKDDTSTLSPGSSAIDNLSALRGVVGDLDQDGRNDDLVITSPNYFYNNFYSYPTGTRASAGYGTYNSPGTRTEYTRVLFGNNTTGALTDLTATNFPLNASDPSGAEDWNGTAVALGDLDGVNGPEIILGGLSPNYTRASDVRVFKNSGTGSFTLDAAFQPTSQYQAPYTVYYQYMGVVNTTYQYIGSTARYILGVPTAMAIGDLDGDTDMDVVVAREYHDWQYVGLNPTYIAQVSGYATVNYAYVYAYSNGTGYPNLYTGIYYYFSALEILDNDISGSNGLVNVPTTRLPSVGDDSLATPVPAFPGRDVAIGDLDGQNGNDIVVTWNDPTTVSAVGLYYGSGYDTARVATRVLMDNGSGPFPDATSTWMPSGSSPEFYQGHQLELADLDGDGDLDLVLLHGDGLDAHLTGGATHTMHALRILRNDRPTTNSFRNVTATALPALPTNSNDDFRGKALVVRDLNGDGLIDIAIGTTEALVDSGGNTLRSTRLFLGTGSLTFKRADSFLPAVTTDTGEAETLLLGDLAGSGLPTLIQLTETAPATSGSSEFLRTQRWNK